MLNLFFRLFIKSALAVSLGIVSVTALPSHKSIELQGLHAYADRESVPAGETIRFHVSSQIPYRFRVTKLGGDVDNRASDETIFLAEKDSPAQVQSIHPGSYIQVKKGLPADEALTALTLECWVRSWNLTQWQGILTQHDFPNHCGYGLFIDADGRAVFSIGNGGKFDENSMVKGPMLSYRQWHHLVGTWDDATKTAAIWMDGKQHAIWTVPQNLMPRKAGLAQLRIGAYSENDEIGHFFDGDIAMPAIYKRVLSGEEIGERSDALGLKSPDLKDASLAAFWPLDEERGINVVDASGHGRNGEVVNLGTWMVGGPSFDGKTVGRYDSSYNPKADTTRGHGLRLASDDLYDCNWVSTETFRDPQNARSGIYAAWFDFELDGVPHHYPVTFIVKKQNDAPKAPLVVMCSTNTWRAYV
ncbi:MAG: LamG domain-containing protein, partial [Verrucomicrobia bacterium]|nr:LamG domain-containing protein [Verrucomicrobiota bacterium]